MQACTYGFGSSGDNISGLCIFEHTLGAAGNFVCLGAKECVDIFTSHCNIPQVYVTDCLFWLFEFHFGIYAVCSGYSFD
jgi:hypothetical protein